MFIYKGIWLAGYLVLCLHYKIKIKVMATRSLIGIKLDNDIIKTIYCHWDGYPEHNGQILVANYTSPTAVMELIEGGDLSSLDWSPHRCTKKECDWTMREPREVSVYDMKQVADDYGVEYVYVYNDEFEWECYEYYYGSKALIPVNILAVEDEA